MVYKEYVSDDGSKPFEELDGKAVFIEVKLIN
jgi:hypothetical protein